MLAAEINFIPIDVLPKSGNSGGGSLIRRVAVVCNSTVITAAHIYI